MLTAFVGGRVFVGDGKAFEQGTVLVEGERIVKVSKGEIPVPKDAQRIALDGCTLLPGFIDCHVHVCLDGSPDPVGTLVREHASLVTLKAAESARRTLLAGVTSVRDMGGKDGIDLALREAIRSGLISGPRMLASGRLICMTGGHGWQVGQEADGPDEVMRAAREQIKAGADVVKLMATGGVMTPDVEPGSEQLTEEELSAGIQEAHKAGRKTATHAMGTQGILNALRAGIDSIEHGVFLNEEAISLMVKRDVPLIPTLSALYHIEKRGIEAGIPPFAVEKTHRVKPFHLESVRMARGAGVHVAMGTDAGTPFNMHGENLGELRRLVEVGYSSMEAIQAGTQIAAKVMGLGEELGTIEEGKLADLIVVEGDPLEDIGLLLSTEAIRLVMRGGKLVKGEW
ncbi:MAG: amidohydrolase family protein [Candidatus Bathyarchaeota archaeon]|nr:amidohydrolase family protein [Candidatus Bathyarchaeota archaeon]